jgi:hypothetical protein
MVDTSHEDWLKLAEILDIDTTQPLDKIKEQARAHQDDEECWRRAADLCGVESTGNLEEVKECVRAAQASVHPAPGHEGPG